MKIGIPTLIIMLFTASMLSAQSYFIEWNSEQPVRGSESESVIKYKGTIKNLGFDDKILYFRYDISKIASGHDGAFCFGANCFFLFDGPDDPLEREGQRLEGFGSLSVEADINPNGLKGTSVVSYTMFDGNDTSDTLAFSVTYFIDKLTSVPTAESVGITWGPSPSTSSLSINGDALLSVTGFNLIDASGALNTTFISTPSSSQQIDLSRVSNGAYTLVLTQTNGAMFTIPVVVSR